MIPTRLQAIPLIVAENERMDIDRFPEDQLRIIRRCYHPTGLFDKFQRGEIEQTIAHRFEKMVATYPDRLAIIAADQQVTYEQLNHSANAIAQNILDQLGEQGEPVALLFDHNVAAAAATIGALKAGKFYVPMTPTLPRAVLGSLLHDCGTRLIVADGEYEVQANLLGQNGTRVLNVSDIMGDRIAATSEIPRSPDSLAYIYYTSGSTGDPKGVMDTHRNVLHNVMRYTNTLHFCPSDRMALVQPFGASGSVSTLFGALLNGATVLPFDLSRMSFRHLAHWLKSQGITAFHSTPGVFRNVMEHVVACPELRLVRLEGDRALPNDVEAYAQKCSDSCILVNGLGATECGLVRQYFIGKETAVADDLVPVGYGVEDFEVQLVPEEQEGPGSGQAGEIAFKSAYLARGYWKNRALTDSRFLPDAVEQESRLYLTGDRGHMRADGCLVLVGRTRRDVKVLGQNVELGEVEAALAALPSIEEVAVVANNDKGDQTRLIAYYVTVEGEHPSNKTLRQGLEEALPGFMIPSLFIKLDAFPLTVGGKLDYKALPSPGSERPITDWHCVSPRTPVEESLMTIWMEVLGIARMGVHDDFRDLGGNSMMAGQIISRVIDAFQVELSLRALLQCPTVAKMATFVTRGITDRIDERELERILENVESEVLD